jgi:hypothetical protein
MNDTKHATPGIKGGQGNRASNVAVSAMVFGWCLIAVGIVILVGDMLEWWNR